MLKKVLVLVLILLAAGFLAYYFIFKNKDDGTIILYGNIEIRTSDLGFRVSGRLKNLYFEEGDTVEKGDLLAEIEADTYKTSFLRAKADVRKARAQKLDKAANYRFNAPLCADGIVSKEECVNLKNDMDMSNGAYDGAVADLEQAIINLDDTKLYAPYKGIILSRVLEAGTILGTSDTVYTVSMTEPVWVRAYIEECELGKVKLGQKAYVYTDSRPNDPYIAHVGFISPVAEFTPKTVETTKLRADLVYRVRIIIDNTDLYLRQGMPVTVKILED